MKRNTVKDWKNNWLKANGFTNDYEVVITDSKSKEQSTYVYEGCFADIPENLLEREVVECWKILASSVPEREGAYSLVI